MKTYLKNMYRIKRYGQNKIRSHILAISFVFLPYFCSKKATPKEALPNGPQSSSLYFWNQWKQENRNNLHANSKFNFLIFCPSLLIPIHDHFECQASSPTQTAHFRPDAHFRFENHLYRSGYIKASTNSIHKDLQSSIFLQLFRNDKFLLHV